MAREEISETAENMKSIAVNEDSHDNQRYDKTKESPQNSFRAALPVTIITDPAEAQASETRESNRESREKDGLEVARKALDAAKDSAFYALIGVIISFAGFCALIWTLCETRKTANASVDSAKAAKDAVNIARNAFDDSKIAAAESAVKVAEALEAAQSTIRQFQLIADANAALVKQAERSADAAEKISVESAENARESLRLLNESIAHNQRPLISVSTEADTLKIKSGSIYISARSYMKNVGLSVGIRCTVMTSIYGSYDKLIEASSSIKKSPGSYISSISIGGRTIFPGEIVNGGHDLILSAEEIGAARIEYEQAIEHKELFDGPCILIAVVYQLPGSNIIMSTISPFLIKHFNGSFFDLSKEDTKVDRSIRIKLFPASLLSHTR